MEMKDARIPADMFSQVFPPARSLYRAVDSHLEFGHKAGEFLVPVVERGCRGDDQEWTPDVVSLCGNRKKENTSSVAQQVVFVRGCLSTQ